MRAYRGMNFTTFKGYKQRKPSLPSRHCDNVWSTGTSQNLMVAWYTGNKYLYFHHFLCPDMKVAHCVIDSTGL